MIYNAEWRRTFQNNILPTLASTHPDLSNIVSILRNTAVEVWTETPSDQDKITGQAYSLEGWRVHFKNRYAAINGFNTSYGTVLQSYDSQAKNAIDGLLMSLPTIVVAFSAIVENYTTGGALLQQTLTQADREILAAAIEAELQ